MYLTLNNHSVPSLQTVTIYHHSKPSLDTITLYHHPMLSLFSINLFCRSVPSIWTTAVCHHSRSPPLRSYSTTVHTWHSDHDHGQVHWCLSHQVREREILLLCILVAATDIPTAVDAAVRSERLPSRSAKECAHCRCTVAYAAGAHLGPCWERGQLHCEQACHDLCKGAKCNS